MGLKNRGTRARRGDYQQPICFLHKEQYSAKVILTTQRWGIHGIYLQTHLYIPSRTYNASGPVVNSVALLPSLWSSM